MFGCLRAWERIVRLLHNDPILLLQAERGSPERAGLLPDDAENCETRVGMKRVCQQEPLPL